MLCVVLGNFQNINEETFLEFSFPLKSEHVQREMQIGSKHQKNFSFYYYTIQDHIKSFWYIQFNEQERLYCFLSCVPFTQIYTQP